MVIIREGRVALLSLSWDTFLLLFQTNFAQSYMYGAQPPSPPSHGGTAPCVQPPRKETSPAPHQVVPAHGGQYTITSAGVCTETNSITPKTLIPKSPWKRRKGRERRTLASYRFPSPRSRHSLFKKAFPLNYSTRKNSWSTTV